MKRKGEAEACIVTLEGTEEIRPLTGKAPDPPAYDFCKNVIRWELEGEGRQKV